MYAELRPIPASRAGESELRFTTVYEGSKDLDAEQLKFQLILDPTALRNLVTLINSDD